MILRLQVMLVFSRDEWVEQNAAASSQKQFASSTQVNRSRSIIVIANITSAFTVFIAAISSSSQFSMVKAVGAENWGNIPSLWCGPFQGTGVVRHTALLPV